jgi:hypothetical protein
MSKNNKTWKSTLVVMAGLVLAVSISARADMIIAQQEQDFQANNNGHPDTIGSGTWTYMYSDDINPTVGTTGLLTWNPASSEYDLGGTDYYPDGAMQGSMLTMAPEVGGAATTRYGVMRWTSGVAGPVNVAGTWTHYWPSSGDGMEVAVYANGVQMFDTLLTSGSANFDFDINVSPGNVVDYVVGPGSLFNGNYDRADIETTITLVPVPGAILLGILGLGAAGLKLRRFA